MRLTPKSSSSELIGLRDTADGSHVLAIKVTAVPDKGKANKSLTKLIAKSLRSRAGKVELLRGHSSRNKEVLVRGNSNAIMAAIKKWLEDTS